MYSNNVNKFTKLTVNKFQKYCWVSKYFYPLFSVVIATVIIVWFLRYEEMSSVGNDIMLHIYPVWLLTKQLTTISWPFWGLWDPYRYCGYPYLTAYAPLFYYVAAFLSLLFNITPAEAVKWVVIITFPCSAITMYYSSRYIVRDYFGSMISSLAYVLVPLHMTSITHVGNPTYSLAFVFIPLVFLYTERLIGGKGSLNNLFLASLSLSLVILSHHGLGFSLAFFLYIFLVLKWLFTRKIDNFGLLIVPLAIAVSAFFVIPMTLYYLKYPFISYPISHTPSPFYESLGQFFLPYGWVPIGLTAFTFGVIAPLFIRKSVEIKIYFALTLIILVTYILSQCASWIIPIGAIGGRAVVLYPFSVSILIGLYVASIKYNSKFVKLMITKSHLIMMIITILMLLEAVSCGIYHPPSVMRYMKAYEYVRNDSESLATLRIWQIPRSHLVAALPIYTEKGTIDGVTFGPKEIDYFILKSIANAGGDGLIGYGWGDLVNDANKTLRVLGIFGVKYVIVDSEEPVYPPNISRTIYQNLKNSQLVDLVANFTDPRYPWSLPQIHVFKMKKWYPIIVAPRAFVLNESNTVEDWKKFYEIASKDNFDPQAGILLSRDNDLTNVPYTIWSEDSISEEDYVNFKLEWLEQLGTNSIGLTIYVDRASFLYIPITFYDPGLKLIVNGQRVKPLKALPNFIALFLPSKGSYTVFISRELSLVEITSLISSFLSLGLMVTFIVKNKNYRKYNSFEGK